MEKYTQSIYLSPKDIQILQLQINSHTLPNHTQDFDPISKICTSTKVLIIDEFAFQPSLTSSFQRPFLFLLLSTSRSRYHSSLSLPLPPPPTPTPVHRTSPLKFSTLHINAGA